MKYKNNIKKLLVIIIILFLELFLYHKYYYCIKCIKKYKKLPKCNECPTNIIFNGLRISSDKETLHQIINHKKSIGRYGDGEYKLIFGKKIRFQKFNQTLSNKLKEVLDNNDKDFLVGINLPYKILDKLTNHEIKFWKRYFMRYKFRINKLLNKKKKYYSATITRFYYRYKDKSNAKNAIKTLKKIWEDKNILIIEGDKSRIGIGNDLFKNAKSIKRIICPTENAFDVYDKIIKNVLKLKEKRLILIALGPTATVLAYDLYKLGYQSIDFGHLDIEYEWFLRNTTQKIQIKNKFVNEAEGKSHNFTKVKDKNYYKQIIAKILN